MVRQHRGTLSDLKRLNTELEEKSAADILRWALGMFGKKIALSSSFQTQSMPLLHIVSEHVPELPVLFLDTGFHFPETLAFRDQLIEQWGLSVINLHYAEGHGAFQRKYGALYKRDPDMCCYLNKVEPMREALKEYDAWVSGIRRDQTENRANTPVVEQRSDGVYKICPMVRWTGRDIMKYINDHDLPVHPLLSQGYMSVGCAPCTRPSFADDRSGRWAGSGKTECGIHTEKSDGTKDDE
jgi:phosphoadenosine phosphosulfate reductase